MESESESEDEREIDPGGEEKRREGEREEG